MEFPEALISSADFFSIAIEADASGQEKKSRNLIAEKVKCRAFLKTKNFQQTKFADENFSAIHQIICEFHDGKKGDEIEISGEIFFIFAVETIFDFDGTKSFTNYFCTKK